MSERIIWFDIVNSPHVLVLEPLLRELSRQGMRTVITAKDHAQTIGLLRQKGLAHTVIGRHGGHSGATKALALMSRVGALLSFAISQKPDLTVCHGSRELIIVSKLLGIPNVTLFDYEYSEHRIKNWGATLMLMPDVIPMQRMRELGYRTEKLCSYPGIKEQIYLRRIPYDPEYLKCLGIDPEQILAVFRPPATLSHYHDEKSESLIDPLLDYLDKPGVSVVIMPRYALQAKELFQKTRKLGHRPIILETPIDGPMLLAHADLAISGGGTMIREAAALHTPAYSIFSGKPGGVDEYLVRHNLLTWINDLEDLRRIALSKKRRYGNLESNDVLLQFLCQKILSV